MSEQHNSITTVVEERQKQLGLWAAGIFTALSAAFAGISIYAVVVVQQGRFQIEDTVLMPATIVVTVISLLSYLLIRRGRYQVGIELLFAVMMILPVIAALLIDNFEVIVASYVAIFAPIMFAWVLPKTAKRRAVIIIALVILAMVGIEIWNPSFRGTSTFATRAIPVVTVLAAAILLVYIFRRFRTYTLQTKIVVWMGLTLTVTAAVLVAYSIFTFRQTTITDTEKEAVAISEAQAQGIREKLDLPLLSARTLAIALKGIKDPVNPTPMTRDQVNKMLYELNVANPSFLGTDTLWEPNAFDGLDNDFRNTPGHDATGRFIPYWVRRADGSVTVEPLLDYETPGIGDWYVLPREQKKEMVFAPLVYPINGVDTVMATFVVPIMQGDTFYGIVGVDAPIGFVQNIVDSVNLYDGKADAVLLTSSGTLIGVHNKPELVNQPATEIYPDFSDLQANFETGNAFTSLSPDGKDLRIFSPINIGETGTRWYYSLIIPFAEITAEATIAATRQVAISGGLIFLSLILLWFLARQLVRPILALTNIANEVSQGNLNVSAHVQTEDEVGVLAKTFNLMISQLRDSIGTLESRVAERTRNLELAAEVGRTVSQVRALDVMLKDAAELIRAQFDLYYVQVYLTDPSQTYLNLQAGTGQVGEQLLARSHRLPLNADSINGRSALEKKSVVISDTTASVTFKPNPLLPDTRSEMAVPLMIGDRAVGVLDMQSEHAGSLNKDILSAFEALAGQLAIAIQNATFLAEADQARAEVEKQAARLSRANWVEYLDAVHKPEETGFVFEQNKISPLTQTEQSQTSDNDNALAAPISVTGEKLGTLTVEMDQQKRSTQAEYLTFAVARQVAQQIENLRLLDSAERFRYEAEQASRRLTHEGWQEYMDSDATKGLGYLYDLKEVRPYNQDEDRQTEESELSLPLKVRDETVGKLVIRGLESDEGESVSLANAVAERLGAHIEGLRLSMQTEQALAETKKRAQREQALRQITSVVRGSTDPATILRSAARELGNLLGRKTVVHLTTTNEAQTSQANRPADIEEETVANNGNESVSPADQSR